MPTRTAAPTVTAVTTTWRVPTYLQASTDAGDPARGSTDSDAP